MPLVSTIFGGQEQYPGFTAVLYRVVHLLRERNMLTSNSKFRWWPGSEGKLTGKRNLKCGVNIILSQSRWATLYVPVGRAGTGV